MILNIYAIVVGFLLMIAYLAVCGVFLSLR